MASALAYIALASLLGLGIHIAGHAIIKAVNAVVLDEQMFDDCRDQPFDLIDGDTRPADLLRSPFHGEGQ